MIDLNEIKKYHILGYTSVRRQGSLYSQHPNRCLWDICGKPSIQWVLEAGMGSKYIDKIVVSTDGKEIKKVVEELGVQVVDRPLHQSLDLPRDYTQGIFTRKKPRSLLSVPAPIHTSYTIYTLWYLEKTEGYMADIRVDLGANHPLITTEIIDRMIEKFFEDEEASVVRSYYPILPYVCTLNSKIDRIFPVFFLHGLDKQAYPPFFRQGPCEVRGMPSKMTVGGAVEGYILINPEEGVDMHNEEDLFLAQCYMKRRLERKREEK